MKGICIKCKNREEVPKGFPCVECINNGGLHEMFRPIDKHQSDGSTASYYELPEGATELQDIISFLNCNAQMGEIGRAWMRYGRCPHSPKIRDIKKIIFYAQAELERLEKYEDKKTISINVASAAMSKEQIEEAIKNIINDQHGVSNEKN